MLHRTPPQGFSWPAAVWTFPDVILVGGQSRMLRVQEVVKKCRLWKPRKDVNPDEAVATALRVQGSVLSASDTRDVLLLDVTPLISALRPCGVMTPMIKRNTTIPTKYQ